MTAVMRLAEARCIVEMDSRSSMTLRKEKERRRERTREGGREGRREGGKSG